MKLAKKLTVFLMLLPAFWGCKEKEVSGPAALLPSSVQGLVQISDIKKAYEGIGLLEEKFFGQSLSELKKDPEAVLGFNPFNPEELKSAGVNPSGALGVAVAGLKEQEGEMGALGVFYISADDEQKLLSKIKAVFEKNLPGVAFQEDRGMISFKIDSSSKMYLFAKGGFVFLAFSDPKQDAGDFALSIGQDKNTLADSSRFKEVVTELKTTPDLFVYADFGVIMEAVLPMINGMLLGGSEEKPNLDYLKDYQGFALSMSLTDPDLKMDAVVSLKPGSAVLAILQGVSFNRKALLKISDPAALLASAAFNPLKYGEFLKKQLLGPQQILVSQLNDIFQAFNTQFGLDFKKDVAENLDGNFHLGVFDGKTITMSNYNTLFAFGVKDEAKMKAVLDQMIEKLPAEVKPMITRQGDLYVFTVYGFVQVFLGIKDQTLSVVAGKTLADQVFAGKGKSFTEALEHKLLKSWIEGDFHVFYLNVDEVVLILKNFASLIPYISSPQGGLSESFLKKAGQFHFAASGSDVKGNLSRSDMIVKTRFKEPFFKSISKMVSE